MTEAEWLAETHPGPMLKHLWGLTTERKRRLAMAAFCYRVWHRMGHPWQVVLEVMERQVDGLASQQELEAASHSAGATQHVSSGIWCGDDANTAVVAAVSPDLNTDQWPATGSVIHFTQMAAAASIEQTGKNRRERKRLWRDAHAAGQREQVDLLRCIFGNPFRPVALAPSWRSEPAVALAAGIYAEGAFDRLPILADALEEAGCDQPDVLGHLRGPGPHARGCWVVDGVLGKE